MLSKAEAARARGSSACASSASSSCVFTPWITSQLEKTWGVQGGTPRLWNGPSPWDHQAAW